MISRRQFLASLAVVGATNCAAQRPAAASKTIIDVKAYGAEGNGRKIDLTALREAIAAAARQKAGATVFFPQGEYFLGAGEADQFVFLSVNRLENISFLGDRATLSCRTKVGESNMLSLEGCRTIAVQGLAFRDYGLNRNIGRLGAIAINLASAGRNGSENIRIQDCAFDSVLSGVTCVESAEGTRCRDITLTNLTVSHSYYGFNFAENGDEVVGRALRCNDVKRSYFPYGVSKHDIELETTNNATRFEDVLIKCYKGDTSGLRVKVKCRGKRGGDAIVSLDPQHENSRGMIRHITLDVDFDDIDCELGAAVLFRSLSPNGKIERRTTNRWDDINIDGNVRICEKTKLIAIDSVPETQGRLRIGPRLARHPQMPTSVEGFRLAPFDS